MSDHAAHARLDGWKHSLLDPRDRLVDLGTAGIPIAVDPMRIAFSLAAGSMLALESGETAALDNGRLRVALSEHGLATELDKLRRDVRTAAAGADHVLWMGLGLVTWPDDAGIARSAPLACWPVELVIGLDGGPRLRSVDDLQPRANHVLLEALQRIHDITIDMGGSLDLDMLFDAAGAAVGWRLHRVARLFTGSFARFDMWRDLDAREDSLPASMPIGFLTGELGVPPLPPATGDLLTPLDADASQLAVVATAGAGGSFVVDAPAGTGKTQTIANLAVHAAAHGKRVLVVSDRASALDALAERLASAGFGELALPLHAGRTRVLDALLAVASRAHRPVHGTSSAEARLSELRSVLDGYASALHRVGPLGLSIHEVLGRLVELRTAPRAELAERDASALDRATFGKRKAAVQALADAASTVDPIAQHPWRVSALSAWHPDGTERATRALNELASAVESLSSAIADVTALIPYLVTRTPEQLRALGALAEVASASPRPGAELLTSMRGAKHDEIGERIALIRARGAGSLEVPRDPGSFLAIATRHRALVAEVEERFKPVIDELEIPGELWSQLKRWTSSMAPLRYVALRNARAALKAAALPGQLETDEAMLAGLEAVIAERACREALLAAAEPARRWFGDLSGDALTLDLAKIEEAVAWGAELRKAFDALTIASGEPGKQAAWRALVAQVAASPAASAEKPAVELAVFSRLASAVTRWEPALGELATIAGIPQILLGNGADHLASLGEQVAVLRDAVGSLADWTRFHLARRDAHVAGIGPAVGAIERGDLAATDLAAAWERATLLAWLDVELGETPELELDGLTHHTYVASFADLDRGAIALMRARIVAKLAERAPRASEVAAELAVLREEREAHKPRSLRDLLSAVPALVAGLTPVVLATPHAVASALTDAHAPFDVVVFDEAARLTVGDALGALARSHAAVFVGDSRELLPSVGESLLAAARAVELPVLPLAAQYRMRHEDLFAFVNGHHHGDRVELLPVPARGSDAGVSFRLAETGDVELVLADIKARLADPARTRTFAIVTPTAAEAARVEALVDADAAVAAVTLVGTPARLQGETRDVAYLLPGDATAVLDGGALVVATTRAREQLVVVGRTETYAGELGELVAFARAGGGASKPADDVGPSSPITAAIARALGDRGWSVKHQVGCGPYKIDLAVTDPNDPDRYVLAIEHDGSAYARASSSRTRDRLRTQLLTSLGWRVHRIWSLDWWTDAERELQRVHGAIVAAIAASRQRVARSTMPPPVARPRRVSARVTTPPVVAVAVPDTVPTSVADSARVLAAGSGPNELPEGSGPVTPLKLPRGAIAIGPYTPAAVPAGRRAPDDMFAARYASELGKCIEQVLAAEAPIHIELLARRVGAYFGIGKITPAVVGAIRAALPAGRGQLGEEPNIVWRANQDPSSVPSVRVAGQAHAARRDIAEVPLAELAGAARIVVERANGLATTDLVRDCARLLGFSRITDQVSARVALGIRIASARKLITIDDGKAHLSLE